MTKRRILAIGLDGFEISLAEAMMAEGALPHLARMRSEGLSFALDHGDAKNSGLAWEHISEGLWPEDGARHSAVTLDPATYRAHLQNTSARPVLGDLHARTVIFDVPYFDLARAPTVLGFTPWGAHDPGVRQASRPAGLGQEIHDRFGPYPARDWIYGFSWPSPAKTRESGEALTRAVQRRSAVTRWLLAERLPDWQLALVTVSEPHSAAEPLWHGVDHGHPLHVLPSAAPAKSALRSVYEAVDEMIGALHQTFPDAIMLAFGMHGMGRNDADVPAMALLPELLYRHAFGHPHLREREWAGLLPSGVPLLAENEGWESVVLGMIPPVANPPRPIRGWRTLLKVMRKLRLIGRPETPNSSPMDWMPASRYRRFWPDMPAFALPSFYDGRIRINLRGRESQGKVALADYPALCDELRDLIESCLDPITGEPVAQSIVANRGDPLSIGPTDADLHVHFRGSPLGFLHPKLGKIGPLPFRRTGGHTGERGFLYATGPGIRSGNGGSRSAFDVVPTLFALHGQAPARALSGRPIDLGIDADGADRALAES